MIGMYLHHHGSGHRTRGTAIARAMKHPVTGIGSGCAPRGWPGPWLELPLDYDDNPSSTYLDPDASGVLHWAPVHHAGFLERQALIVRWLHRRRPRLVVTDTSVEVTLLARLCGIPVIVSAMPGERRDRPHTVAYDVAEHLLAPWPEAAAPRTWPQAWRDKAWHAGCISRFDERPLPTAAGSTDGRRVLVLWGRGGTDTTAAQVQQAQVATPTWTWVQRGGDHPPAFDLWRELCEADVVITHAGQNAVADVATARRPAVVIAQQRPHDEQRATASAVQRLGLARGLSNWPQASEWPGLLEEARLRGGRVWQAWTGPGSVGVARWLDEQADAFVAQPVRSLP